MDINAITTLIGSVGFPIVMCLLMYTEMGKQSKRHEEEMEKIRQALENNTLAISTLTGKVEGMNHE